ncbi:MAG: hypothetical protein FWD33_01160 [Alphaproteobacteria bacterium]|nr:hypothetical protein [Alphaproteobacteria bacterium]
MYQGYKISVSVQEKTHGNPGAVFFGDISDADMALLAPIVRFKERGDNVVPSVVLLKPNNIKNNSFDAKFYWPLGKQGPLCGQGVKMAARAIKHKYNVPDGYIITLLPDQRFGPGAAPEKFHLQVYGDTVISMLGRVGISKVAKNDKAGIALASMLPDIIPGTIYRSSLGDYMCFYETNNIDKLRASTEKFNDVYDQIHAQDPNAFGLLVMALTKDGKRVETTLSSMGEPCITCSNIGLQIGQMMNEFGILPEVDKNGHHNFEIIHPHRVSDTGEFGATLATKFDPRTNQAQVSVRATVAGRIYLYKDKAGVFRQVDDVSIMENKLLEARLQCTR